MELEFCNISFCKKESALDTDCCRVFPPSTKQSVVSPRSDFMEVCDSFFDEIESLKKASRAVASPPAGTVTTTASNDDVFKKIRAASESTVPPLRDRYSFLLP